MAQVKYGSRKEVLVVGLGIKSRTDGSGETCVATRMARTGAGNTIFERG